MLTAPVRLIRHPLAPWSGPELVVAAGCTLRAGGAGECHFEVAGDLGALVVPGLDEPARADNLWRHTCFEVFLARRGAPGYLEFNFAPSRRWAAYAFVDYRVPAPPPAVAAPTLRAQTTAASLSLTAIVGAGAWPEPDGGALEIGLTAVLEATDGTLGYFALRHPTERPDFHDRGGFALTLDRAALAS
jgi:hypothetical protein